MSAELNNDQARIAAVVARIRHAQAERTAQHPHWVHPVQLLAVSKTMPVNAILRVAAYGQLAFGENYVQEGVEKIQQIKQQNPTLAAQLSWHFIGPIQSNKTRQIATHFDWVESIDRLKIAERLSAQRPIESPPLNILLQVNISAEATKSGFAPDEVAAAAAQIQALPRLRLRGLMAIPAPAPNGQAQDAPHQAMRRLFDDLAAQYPSLDTLSLGMSEDLEAAILAGSTQVRIGSAIFGPRAAPPSVKETT
ncbi:YggS family pyridoxal phosphate-dependent enzyme [Parvibium lacunae]|uniref:Pyridoxal phosphate homeostasis protein n=1 Tax=Parvibium lacunae TaxID=1888893 RepID=A0A368L3U7_9BURK|nr:YggS family pyridoxal phosphate-dependent enzyme [Parvibium lacunae]RCS58257.1 YggS family pyridoxal phosphate-dependent enzyme [Parvibium lacunae]